MPGVPSKGGWAVKDSRGINVGVKVKVLVGRGTGVVEIVATGFVSGTNIVGMNNSDVGVAYVPQSEGDCPQEVNDIDAMTIMAMERLTWIPYWELYLCNLNLNDYRDGHF
jgi:hypothetical protein